MGHLGGWAGVKNLQQAVDVSVIIPTCGRSEDLSRALQALARALPSRIEWEVLVIDNGSDESAERTVGRCSAFPTKVRTIREPTPGLHAARNRGWLEAAGRWLAYLDDDATPDEGWLRGLEQLQSADDVALAGGSCRPAYDESPPHWLAALWDQLQEGQVLWNLSLIEFKPDVSVVPPHLIFGCNFVVRREVLELAGGFHPDGFPRSLIAFRGDGESHVSNIVAQRNMRSVCVSNLSIRHRVSSQRMTEEYLIRRSFDQGVSDSFATIRREQKCRPPSTAWLRMLKIQMDIRKGPARPLRYRSALAREIGFWTHQRVVRRFPALREWVCRPHYSGQLASVPASAMPACRVLDAEWQRWIPRILGFEAKRV